MKLGHIMRFLFVSAIYLAGSEVALAVDASTSTGGTTGTSTSTGTTAGTSTATSATTTATNSTSGSVAPTASQGQVESKIAARFSGFAGSTVNADRR